MPRKIAPATNWEPIDLRREGPSIFATLQRARISEVLATQLPNWTALDEDGRTAAQTVVFAAFLSLIKDRKDSKDFPHVRTVKSHLKRIDDALSELADALGGIDRRTATVVSIAAGSDKSPADGRDGFMPVHAFERGHRRVQSLKRDLKKARIWTTAARTLLPKQDARTPNEVGLEFFAQRMAHVWENYGRKRFTASRNYKTGPAFIRNILRAGGFSFSEPTVLKAAQSVARELRRNRDDRIVVGPTMVS